MSSSTFSPALACNKRHLEMNPEVNDSLDEHKCTSFCDVLSLYLFPYTPFLKTYRHMTKPVCLTFNNLRALLNAQFFFEWLTVKTFTRCFVERIGQRPKRWWKSGFTHACRINIISYEMHVNMLW